MDNFLIQFTSGTSRLENLTPKTRVLLFFSSVFALMVSMDLRLILPVAILQGYLLYLAHPSFKRVRFIFISLLIFNFLNIFMFYLANPSIGSQYVSTETVIFSFGGRFIVSIETLYYFFIRLLKIFSTVIATLWFITTITPSELNAGITHCGLGMKTGMIVALALRYMPDTIRDYQQTKLAMQLRGMEFNAKKIALHTRLKQSLMIIFPLIVVSLDNVKNIANAMDLRGFGLSKKRTFYCDKEPKKMDRWLEYLSLFLCGIALIYIIGRMFLGFPDLWYPF